MQQQTEPRYGAGLHGDQIQIPGALMRGGTSRGPFFLARDLPAEPAHLRQALLHIMGSPHPLQVDGVGGSHPITSKAGIVSPSTETGIDLDFTFAQLQPRETTVQMRANCGNMLSASLPFAIERGLIQAESDITTARVRSTNTGLIAEISVQTPQKNGSRYPAYTGEVAISGVGGKGAPVEIMFVNTAGSIAGCLYPTGSQNDEIELSNGVVLTVTCIDNGQPMVIVRATDLGKTGNESVAELEADTKLKEQLEELRLICGEKMGLGNTQKKSYPKMTLVSRPKTGAINTRSFIPHAVHESIGVLAAVTVATAATSPETVAYEIAEPGDGKERTLNIEHPSGSFSVDMQFSDQGEVLASGITRTARLIMDGNFYIPHNYFRDSHDH